MQGISVVKNAMQQNEWSNMFTSTPDAVPIDSSNPAHGTFETKFTGYQLGGIMQLASGTNENKSETHFMIIECDDTDVIRSSTGTRLNRDVINKKVFMQKKNKANAMNHPVIIKRRKATWILYGHLDERDRFVENYALRTKLFNCHIRFVGDVCTNSGIKQLVVMRTIDPDTEQLYYHQLLYKFVGRSDNIRSVKKRSLICTIQTLFN